MFLILNDEDGIGNYAENNSSFEEDTVSNKRVNYFKFY